MSAETLIELTGVGKRYPPARTTGDRLQGLWGGLVGRSPSAAGGVLDRIDLRVDRGEALAVLGENGAGKSTLLKIVAGVIPPSTGSVRVNGRLGALLSLGAGFHPEFSGRQNVRTAATLAALTPDEIDARMDDIIEFAQLGASIDQPVKHYSSGMTVRLGFAVITAIRPDVLISDEVLAVGDESFQKKCIRWLEAYLAGGGTLLLVSHSVYHVQKLCQRALWLHRGRIRDQGDVFSVSQAYLAHHEAKLRASTGAGPGCGRVRIDRVRVNGSDARDALLTRPDAGLDIVAEISGGRPGDRVSGAIRQTDGAVIARARAAASGSRVRFGFSRLPLLPGHYQIELSPLDRDGRRCGHAERRLLRVAGSSREFGCLRMPRQWR